MWTAFPPSDYYADSATPRAHQPASGLAGPPPAARRARGASHVHHDPFDRVGSWLYPYSPSGGHSQPPAGHHARVKQPGAERAAVKQSGIVAVDDPDPPGFGSLKESRGFYHQFAFALPFGLASTHAGVWQCRPAVTLSGRLPAGARSRASAVPSFSGPLHQPGAGIPAGTDEMLLSVISFRMAPRGARSTSSASITATCAATPRGHGTSPSSPAGPHARRCSTPGSASGRSPRASGCCSRSRTSSRTSTGSCAAGRATSATETPPSSSTRSPLHAVNRLSIFVANRHQRDRRFGWWVVARQSPNRLGLINLNGIVVPPRAHQPRHRAR